MVSSRPINSVYSLTAAILLCQSFCSLPRAGAQDGQQYLYKGRSVSKSFYQATLIAKDADLLQRNNRQTEALARLNQAVQLAPDFVEAEVNLGNLQLQLGQVKEAISHLKHAVANPNTIEEAYVLLGRAQSGCGQAADAVKTYEMLLKKYPSSKYAAQANEIMTALKKEQKNTAATQIDSTGTSMVNLQDYYDEAVGGKPVRWPSDMMPLTVFIQNGEGKIGYQSHYCGMLKDSFTEWQKCSAGLVSFQFITDQSKKANVIVEWIDDPTITKSTQKRGETKLKTNDKNIVSATIHLLIGKNQMSDQNFRFTCLHEIGHALGIKGHSPSPDDLMFFSTSVTARPAALSSRDINTLKKIYKPDYFAQKDVAVQHENGVVALEKKDYNAAIEAFSKVLNARPDLESARVNLALCYAGAALELDEEKKYDEAEKIYKEALRLRRTLAQPQLLNSAVQNFAAMLRERGKTQEALEVEKQLKLVK